MKLLTEVTELIEIVSECVDGKPNNYFIEGIFIQCEEPNRNSRKYMMEYMQPEVDRYVTEYVKKNRAYGELGHPENPTINLDRVSHLITSLDKKGTTYVGRAKILDTPNGKIVKAFIDGGCMLGVSTRGLGSLKQDGQYSVVQPDYKIMTAADIVADPSAHEAFVEAVMESKEWVWNNGAVKEVTIDSYKKKLDSSKRLQEDKIAIFTDFLSRL